MPFRRCRPTQHQTVRKVETVGRHIHGAALFPGFLVLKWGEQPSKPSAGAGQWIAQNIFTQSDAMLGDLVRRPISARPPSRSRRPDSANDHAAKRARTTSTIFRPDGRTPSAASAPPSITVSPSTRTLNSPYRPRTISTSTFSSLRIRAATRTACNPETQ